MTPVMKSPPLLVLILACALAMLAPRAFNCRQKQDAPPPRHPGPIPEEVGEDEVVRIDTDLILLDATVTNAAGEPVLGLRPEDFKLYEDGAECPIAFFKVEKKSDSTRPLAVVFALDTSGSMTPGEMERLRGAVRAFMSRLSERPTLFAVMSFGMNAKILQPLTGDARKLEGVFDRLVREPEGLSTHAYDAVDDAVRLLVRKAPPTRERRLMKRAVVVVTDGFPVGDTVAPSTVIERANRAGVSVYTVTLPSFSRVGASADRPPLPTPLDVSGLVDRTGGTNVYATGESYEPLFRALAEDVTSSYLLAFYPSEEKRRDGRSHSIRIEGPPGMIVRQSRPDYIGNRQ
jgi:VWFA-related protein